MQVSETQLETVNYQDYPLPDVRKPLLTFDNPTWWQKRGLMYTATGYGNKIPTSYMVHHENRMKRVYCRIFSNSGSLYIIDKGNKISIDEV